jgi:hypothetical protein
VPVHLSSRKLFLRSQWQSSRDCYTTRFSTLCESHNTSTYQSCTDPIGLVSGSMLLPSSSISGSTAFIWSTVSASPPFFGADVQSRPLALALAIGAASPTIQISQVWAPLANVIFLLFGGTFLPSPPPWFVWIKWISPITYIFSATIQNEFAGQPIQCRAGGGQCYQSVSSIHFLSPIKYTQDRNDD